MNTRSGRWCACTRKACRSLGASRLDGVNQDTPVKMIVAPHATNRTTDTARSLMNYYAKRWGIETGFRDTKDLRFGMGMSWVRISRPDRRDRLWLLNAFAVVLLTLLGATGEALGYDRYLKANTVKTRTHSLFRQGCMLYDLIPTMPAARLIPLIQRFGKILLEQRVFSQMFCVV